MYKNAWCVVWLTGAGCQPATIFEHGGQLTLSLAPTEGDEGVRLETVLPGLTEAQIIETIQAPGLPIVCGGAWMSYETVSESASITELEFEDVRKSTLSACTLGVPVAGLRVDTVHLLLRAHDGNLDFTVYEENDPTPIFHIDGWLPEQNVIPATGNVDARFSIDTNGSIDHQLSLSWDLDERLEIRGHQELFYSSPPE